MEVCLDTARVWPRYMTAAGVGFFLGMALMFFSAAIFSSLAIFRR